MSDLTPAKADETTDLRDDLAAVINPLACRLGDTSYYGPNDEMAWLSAGKRVALKMADNLISGPLAQREAAHAAEIQAREAEIARLKAERDACIRDMERNGTCKRVYSDAALGVSLEAAEARADRLAEALEAAAYLIDRLEACHAGRRVRDLGEATSAYQAARAALPEAITPKETSDVQN